MRVLRLGLVSVLYIVAVLYILFYLFARVLPSCRMFHFLYVLTRSYLSTATVDVLFSLI
jgi:hypothetical protein